MDPLFQDLLSQSWSEDAFLAVSDMGNRPMELANGRLILLDMPTPRHQQIAFNFARVLAEIAVARKAGRVYMAPMPVRLWPYNFRGPDVFFYRAKHLDRIQEQYGGPPDLVIEILSPRSAAKDLHEKMDEYAKAGIPEYWVVDPKKEILHLHLLEGGEYVLVETVSRNGRLRSRSCPFFAFNLKRVFEK